MNTKLIVGIVALVLTGVALGAAVQTDVIDLGDDRSQMSLDAVPNESNVVVYVDSGVVDNPTTEKVANHVINKSPSQNKTYSEMLDNASNESDIDVEKIQSGTIFGNVSTDYDSVQQDSAYFGVIMETEFSEDRFVEIIKNESEEGNLTQETYNGHTIHIIKSERASEYSDDPVYIGVLGDDGRFVIGTEDAVKDSIDAVNGDKEELSGDLREHLENKEDDSHITFAYDLPKENSPGDDVIVNKTDIVSGAYYTENGDTMGVSITIQTDNENSSDIIQRQIDGGLATVEQRAENETVKSHVRKVNVGLDNTRVTIDYETSVSKFNKLVDYMYNFSLFGR
jgi:hypothetical protein